MTLTVVTADDVCVAVENTLTEWLPPTLAAIARARELDPAVLRPPTAFEQLPDERQITDALDQLPALALTSPGLSGRPQLDEEGSYRAGWTVNAFLATRGASFRETQRLVRLYAAGIRAVLVQHPRLGGFAETVDWVGEDYARLRSNDGARTIGACLVEIVVTVAAAVNAYDAPVGDYPAAPSPSQTYIPQPPADLDLEAPAPTVQSTVLTVQPEA